MPECQPETPKRRYEKSEKGKSATRRYRTSDKGQATARSYYLKHRDEILQRNRERAHLYPRDEYRRRWVEKNPEKRKEASRAWYRKNKDKAKAAYHARRSRIKGAAGKYTKDEWTVLVTQYGNRCLMCGNTPRKDDPWSFLTPDHVIPLLLGGSNDIGNIQPLCRRCNSIKNKKHIDYRTEWA